MSTDADSRRQSPPTATLDWIDLWSPGENGPAVVGASRRFNVNGRVTDVSDLVDLTYSVNGSAPKSVVVRRRGAGHELRRLQHEGDFLIDTLEADELTFDDLNELLLWGSRQGGRVDEMRRTFSVADVNLGPERLSDRLVDADVASQVAQVVDGRWRVTQSRQPRSLSVNEEDAGLDRIVLLSGEPDEGPFAVSALVRVARWTRARHNVGLLFGWQGHRQGDGTELPAEWTTGLAYYYSHCDGLRLRLGDDVHVDADGVKRGDSVLGEAPVSRSAATVAAVSARLLPRGTALRQIRPGKAYWFRAAFTQDEWSLTVWQEGRERPAPQVVVSPPSARPPQGACGIIAHYCAVDVEEFSVEALSS